MTNRDLLISLAFKWKEEAQNIQRKSNASLEDLAIHITLHQCAEELYRNLPPEEEKPTTSMTDFEQRITIGKLCGYELSYSSILPDYPNDLNAMHKAEKVLQDESWQLYRDYVERLGSDIHATASQRAKAFLQVKNLWLD